MAIGIWEDSNLVGAITSGIAQLGGLEAHVGKLPRFPNALFNAVHEQFQPA